MADFLKGYKNWENLTENQKKEVLTSCAGFYEEKAIDYILANLPIKKQKDFVKEPLTVKFDNKKQNDKDISFGDNIVYVTNGFLVESDKKTIFFKVARNTICAVFVNLFYNTASDPNKKTRFGNLANGFFASITNEFAKGKDFENDMMEAYEAVLGEVLDMGPVME